MTDVKKKGIGGLPKFLNIPKKNNKISFNCTDKHYSQIIKYCNDNDLTLTEGITEIIDVFFNNREILFSNGKLYISRR